MFATKLTTKSFLQLNLLLLCVVMLSACQVMGSKAAAKPLQTQQLNDLLVAEFSLVRGDYEQSGELFLSNAIAIDSIALATRSTYAAQSSHNKDLYIRSSRVWVALDSNNPEAWQHLAQAFLNVDDIKEAKKTLHKNITQHPDYIYSVTLLANILINEENYLDADTLLQAFTDKADVDTSLITLHAQILRALNQHPKAQALLASAIQNNPEDINLLFFSAALYLDKEAFELAQGRLKQAETVNPQDSQAQYNLGVFYESANLPNLAVQHYSKVTSGPNLSKSLVAQLKLLSFSTNNADQVFSRLRFQYQMDADLVAQIYLLEGNFYLENRLSKLALSTYVEGLDRFPGHIDLLYNHGVLQGQFGAWQLFEQSLQKIITIQPNHANSLNALGYYYADSNQKLDLAKLYITKALALKPDEPAIIDSMGWLLYRLGNLAKAKNYLQVAWQALPNAEVGAHLGAVEWALGNTKTALNIWNSVLKKDLENTVVKRIIEESQRLYSHDS